MLKGAVLPALGSITAFSLPKSAAAIETSSAPGQRPKLKISDIRTSQVAVHGPQTHIRVYTSIRPSGVSRRFTRRPSIRTTWHASGIGLTIPNFGRHF